MPTAAGVQPVDVLGPFQAQQRLRVDAHRRQGGAGAQRRQAAHRGQAPGPPRPRPRRQLPQGCMHRLQGRGAGLPAQGARQGAGDEGLGGQQSRARLRLGAGTDDARGRQLGGGTGRKRCPQGRAWRGGGRLGGSLYCEQIHWRFDGPFLQQFTPLAPYRRASKGPPCRRLWSKESRLHATKPGTRNSSPGTMSKAEMMGLGSNRSG